MIPFVTNPNKRTVKVTAGYIRKLIKYIFLLFLKLNENPVFFHPSPAKVRSIIVQTNGDTSHMSSPGEPLLPVTVPIFS